MFIASKLDALSIFQEFEIGGPDKEAECDECKIGFSKKDGKGRASNNICFVIFLGERGGR